MKLIETFFKLLKGGAFDEWNERLILFLLFVLLVDSARRILGRAKFKFELTNIAKSWIKHNDDRAVRNGDSTSSLKVKINPHPKLNVLLEELGDQLHTFRQECDDNFRSVRREFEDGLRENRRDVRKELDAEVKDLRQQIKELK